jgi:hypothetical protein
MPGFTVRSWGVHLKVPHPPAFAARLRTGRPPVFCRTAEDGVLFDLRTVAEERTADLARAVGYALEGDELPDDA